MITGISYNAQASAQTDRSTIVIKETKWKTIDVKGWDYELIQERFRTASLTPAKSASVSSALGAAGLGGRFENQNQDGGGELQIRVSEKVVIFGRDDRLQIASNESPAQRSITVWAAPGAGPSLAESFTLDPSQ